MRAYTVVRHRCYYEHINTGEDQVFLTRLCPYKREVSQTGIENLGFKLSLCRAEIKGIDILTISHLALSLVS